LKGLYEKHQTKTSGFEKFEKGVGCCVVCGYKKTAQSKLGKFKKNVSRSAYYWRARKILERVGIKIPKNMHIHHRDEDWTNNTISNLEIISKYEHRRKYHKNK